MYVFQLPEVKLQFAKGRSESHLLEASLTPEGTRVYRLDGRLRSGVQVKVTGNSCGSCVLALHMSTALLLTFSVWRTWLRLQQSTATGSTLPAISDPRPRYVPPTLPFDLACCLQDFLRSLGAVVDSTTVIQQASITRLTDSNSEQQSSHFCCSSLPFQTRLRSACFVLPVS